MLRYLIETAPGGADLRLRAIRLLALRFPEVDIERCLVGREPSDPDLWICRAPAEDHVLRWLRDASLVAIGIRRVDQLETGAG